jgi:UDP-glucose-4-epimerase GalE
MSASTEPSAVLVTGGAGYIGSHTCKALARAGYTPVTFDSLEHGHRWAVRWGPLVEGDLGDDALLARALTTHRVRSVVHCAAYCYVGESMTAPAKYFRNNVANTLTLLETMRTCGVSEIVFSSSCASYGVPATLPIDDTAPQAPINPYGESKLVVEKMLHWWGVAHGLKWIALRYFNAAGADPDGEIGEDHTPETHLIPLAIQSALGERGALDVYGHDYPTRDGTAVRDYIHVSDLAEAHVKAVRHLAAGGASAAVNLGTGNGHTVAEVVAMVEAVSGRRVPLRHAPRRAGDPPELVANAARGAALLDWTPRHSDLRGIVGSAWNWHASHRHRVRGGTPHESALRAPLDARL